MHAGLYMFVKLLDGFWNSGVWKRLDTSHCFLLCLQVQEEDGMQSVCGTCWGKIQGDKPWPEMDVRYNCSLLSCPADVLITNFCI